MLDRPLTPNAQLTAKEADIVSLRKLVRESGGLKELNKELAEEVAALKHQLNEKKKEVEECVYVESIR